MKNIDGNLNFQAFNPFLQRCSLSMDLLGIVAVLFFILQSVIDLGS